MTTPPNRRLRQVLAAAGVATVAILVLIGQACARWVRQGPQDRLFSDRAITEAHAMIAEADQRLAALKTRAALIPDQVETLRRREAAAQKVVKELQGLESAWDRAIANPAQQEANREQIGKMQAVADQAAQSIDGLKQEARRIGWERDGAEIDRANARSTLDRIEESYPTFGWYFRAAWRRDWFWVLLAVLGAWGVAGMSRPRPPA